MNKGFLLYELLLAFFLFMTSVMLISSFLSQLVCLHKFIEKRAQISVSLQGDMHTIVGADYKGLMTDCTCYMGEKQKAFVTAASSPFSFEHVVFTSCQLKEAKRKDPRTLFNIELVAFDDH